MIAPMSKRRSHEGLTSARVGMASWSKWQKVPFVVVGEPDCVNDLYGAHSSS